MATPKHTRTEPRTEARAKLVKRSIASPEDRAGSAARRTTPAAEATSRGWTTVIDLLGRRAAMRVLWELRGGPRKFRPLQAACDGLSPSTLNQRLSELRDARLVTLDEGLGYRLTMPGAELTERLEPLADWADARSNRRAQKRGDPKRGK